MKKVLLVVCILLVCVHTVCAQDFVFQLVRNAVNTTGSPGTLDLTLIDAGEVLDNSGFLVAYYLRRITAVPGVQQDGGYVTIQIAQIGPPPQFNFTLNGHHSFVSGEEFGGISSIPLLHDRLPGASYSVQSLDNRTDRLIITVP
ncbi:MAG TPA: hypothetical protein VN260_02465 [Dissulfurispiraceae bacterium]|nr:hypothetical protein [Dissulfurispiraceae bacterium]